MVNKLNKTNMYILTKKELYNKNACDYKHDDIVICRAYYIHIKYYNENYNGKAPVSWFTKVYVLEDNELKRIHKSQLPKYIIDFIECNVRYFGS